MPDLQAARAQVSHHHARTLRQIPDEIRQGLDIIRQLGVKELDTAQIYGASEELLGNAEAGSSFIIATKCSLPAGPTVATKDEVIKAGKESLEKLKVKSVCV